MYKQVIVVRTDIKMSKGKLVVQSSHASYSSIKRCRKNILDAWERQGQKKVVLKVKSRKELFKLVEKCKKLKIPHALVADAGLTELRSGTITALGVGPHRGEIIDKVTGSLPLLD